MEVDITARESSRRSNRQISSGRVKIGKGTYIGAGAIIRDGITIGEDSVIGAGAVVVKDVAKNLTVVGNPAKTLVK